MRTHGPRCGNCPGTLHRFVQRAAVGHQCEGVGAGLDGMHLQLPGLIAEPVFGRRQPLLHRAIRLDHPLHGAENSGRADTGIGQRLTDLIDASGMPIDMGRRLWRHAGELLEHLGGPVRCVAALGRSRSAAQQSLRRIAPAANMTTLYNNKSAHNRNMLLFARVPRLRPPMHRGKLDVCDLRKEPARVSLNGLADQRPKGNRRMVRH